MSKKFTVGRTLGTLAICFGLLAGTTLSAQAHHGEHMTGTGANKTRCNDALNAKNIHGSARSPEMQKCMMDPDTYK
jgi:hypothetical protein